MLLLVEINVLRYYNLLRYIDIYVDEQVLLFYFLNNYIEMKFQS